MLVEVGLCDPHGLVEVLVGQSGIQNFMAVAGEEGRFLAAQCRGPAVEEKDFPRVYVILRKVGRWLISFTNEV